MSSIVVGMDKALKDMDVEKVGTTLSSLFLIFFTWCYIEGHIYMHLGSGRETQ